MIDLGRQSSKLQAHSAGERAFCRQDAHSESFCGKIDSAPRGAICVEPAAPPCGIGRHCSRRPGGGVLGLAAPSPPRHYAIYAPNVWGKREDRLPNGRVKPALTPTLLDAHRHVEVVFPYIRERSRDFVGVWSVNMLQQLISEVLRIPADKITPEIAIHKIDTWNSADPYRACGNDRGEVPYPIDRGRDREHDEHRRHSKSVEQ